MPRRSKRIASGGKRPARSEPSGKVDREDDGGFRPSEPRTSSTTTMYSRRRKKKRLGPHRIVRSVPSVEERLVHAKMALREIDGNKMDSSKEKEKKISAKSSKHEINVFNEMSKFYKGVDANSMDRFIQLEEETESERRGRGANARYSRR